VGKQAIKIGGRDVEIDVVTAEELHNELRSAFEFFAAGYLRPPQVARPEGGVILSAGGAGIAELYVVDPGMVFRMTRLFVTCNAATFGVPLSGLTAGIDVYRGSGAVNDPIDGVGPISTIPQVATWNRVNGPIFRDGEIVRVGVVGGPAAGQLFCRAAGILEPLVGEE
jgi:hypothetical protein